MPRSHSVLAKNPPEQAGIVVQDTRDIMVPGWPEMRVGSIATLTLVLIVSTILMIIFHNRFWAPPDEGNYAHVAERILSGQVLHRDVQDVHAGYVNFVNAGAFSIFGLKMVSMRYPLAALTVL